MEQPTTAAALVLLGILLLDVQPRLHIFIQLLVRDMIRLTWSREVVQRPRKPPNGPRMHDLCFVIFMSYFRRIFVFWPVWRGPGGLSWGSLVGKRDSEIPPTGTSLFRRRRPSPPAADVSFQPNCEISSVDRPAEISIWRNKWNMPPRSGRRWRQRANGWASAACEARRLDAQAMRCLTRP